MKLIIALLGLFFSVNMYAYVHTVINNTNRTVCIRLWHKGRTEKDKLSCWRKVYPGEQCQSTYTCTHAGGINLMPTRDYCIEKIDVWDFREPEVTTRDVMVSGNEQCQNNIIQISVEDKEDWRKGFDVQVNPPEEELKVWPYFGPGKERIEEKRIEEIGAEEEIVFPEEKGPVWERIKRI